MSPLTSAPEACEKVLSSLRHSGLHFVVQETPYSSYVTIRKRFSKVPASESVIPRKSKPIDTIDATAVSKFKAEIASKDQKIEGLEETISNLKLENNSLRDQMKKISKSLTNVTKLKEEKDSEVAALRTSLKNQGCENINLKSDSKQYFKNYGT